MLKKTKTLKIVSLICALGILANCFVANAATELKSGDVNNNKVINSEDLLALTDFLEGKTNVSVDRADINGDGVVDSADVVLLENYLRGKATLKNRTVNDMTAANEGTRYYYKHTLSQNLSNIDPNNITPYPLKVNDALGGNPTTIPNTEVLLNTPPSSETSSYTNSAVVKLSDITGFSTGFIIGSDLVATAGHCVYDTKNNKWNNNLKIQVSIYDENGVIIDTKSYTVSEAHISKKYFDWNVGDVDESPLQNEDYALLKINTNGVDLAATYGKLNIRPVTDEKINEMSALYNSSSTTQHVAIAGYSGNGTLHISWGNAFTYNNVYSKRDVILGCGVYGANGDSGSPIIFDKDGDKNTTNDRVVIGIFTFSMATPNARFGPRVTSQLMKFYYDNDKLKGLI